MSTELTIRSYLAQAFRWQKGRQGSGYDKMLLLTGRWPLPFDSYLIRYPEGSEIPPHTDPVTEGRHYRLNLVLKSPKLGGDFVCASPIFASRRIKLFRPDACEHSVTKVAGGSRYVLSLGWVIGKRTHRNGR
ncbi:hypothetical protein ACQVBX_16595 [Dyella sp. KULCS107]|uniref:hypothetical protein n=1 Tax=Dyella sp. KULCS107 TaxID=3422216 RepID=UPI003D6EF2E2